MGGGAGGNPNFFPKKNPRSEGFKKTPGPPIGGGLFKGGKNMAFFPKKETKKPGAHIFDYFAKGGGRDFGGGLAKNLKKKTPPPQNPPTKKKKKKWPKIPGFKRKGAFFLPLSKSKGGGNYPR